MIEETFSDREMPRDPEVIDLLKAISGGRCRRDNEFPKEWGFMCWRTHREREKMDLGLRRGDD